MTRTFSRMNAGWPQRLAMVLCCLALNAAAANEASAPASYTTKAGDTVERLLRNAMPDSPLNPTVLRQALAEANPKVVTGKAGQKFKPGTVIQLPEHGQLVRTTLEAFPASAGEGSSRSGYSASDPASRRHWIRYP